MPDLLYPTILPECQFVDGVWTDLSPWFRGVSVRRGCSRVESPILRYDPGTATLRLDNRDRRFDPTHMQGPYVSGFSSDSGAKQFVCEALTSFGQGWTVDVKSAAGQNAEIRNVSSVASGTTGSFSCAKPPGTVAGDLLIAWHFADVGALADLGTPSGGASWGTPLATRSEGDGTLHCKLWDKAAAGSEPSTYGFTQNGGADGIVIIVAIKAGTWDTGSSPVVESESNPETALFSTPATDPAGANDLELRVVAGSSAEETGGTWTPPQEEGWQEWADRQSGRFITASLAVKQLTGVGGGSETQVKPGRPVRIRASFPFTPTTNLVENPSFELDASGWESVGARSGIARVPDVSWSGGYALEVRRLAQNPPFMLYGATATGVASGAGSGDTVTVSAYIYVPAASFPKLTGVAISATGMTSDFVTTTGLAADTWYRVSRTATLSASLDNVQIQFWTDDAHADGQIVAYVDAVQAEEASSATPYCDGSLPGCSWGTSGTPPVAISEAFEDATLDITVTNGGSAAWARTSTQAHAGSWSLRSGTITHSQTSDAIVTVPAGATQVRFWYRVSSESGFDFFRFLIGGVQQFQASGTAGAWVQSSAYAVTEGQQITFRYMKDGSESHGEDAAYIDDVSFTGPSGGGGPGTPHASASSRPSSYTFPLFSGFADDWLVDWTGSYDSEVTVPCTDGLSVAADNDRAAGAAVGTGEDAGARVDRILTSIGWPEADRSIATGDTALQATTLEGNGLAELQLVADTEIGELFQDASGLVVFRNRQAILTEDRSVTVQARFGPGGTSQGRLPYHDVGITSDRTQLYNVVRITRAGGTRQTASDAASIAEYRTTRTYDRDDLLMQSDAEAMAYASWVLYLAKEVELRFDRLEIRPEASPAALFPQILAREIGDRIEVERQPTGGGDLVVREVFVRGIEHEMTHGANGTPRWETAWVLQSAVKAGNFLTLGHPELGRIGRNALVY